MKVGILYILLKFLTMYHFMLEETNLLHNYMILSKNSTVVYYNEIKKIRIFPHRRFFARVLIPSLYPIFYAAQSKSLFMNTKKCKKKIQEIKVINKYRQFSFGKDDCNLN